VPGTASSGGRNRKTRDELQLAGTLRTDRHGSEELTPDPPAGRPTQPDGLGRHALREWTRMVERLEASRTLSIVDDAALYQYCSLYGETEDVQDARLANAAHIETLEATIGHDGGENEQQTARRVLALKLRQLDMKYTTQLRQGRMALRAYLVEFGMTPSARARVKVSAPPAATDPMAEFDEPKA
jgi:P27 family predicted phage terminase small subunit